MSEWNQGARTYDAQDDVNAQAQQARAEGLDQGSPEALAELKARELAAAVGEGKRAFVFPTHRNYRKLVKAGELVQLRDANSPLGTRDTARTGDVWVTAVGGICVIDPSSPAGAAQVAWCEAHPDICRDAMAPETEVWASMKESQLNTSTREPTLPQNINVDKVLAGDFSGFAETGSIAARARAMVGG